MTDFSQHVFTAVGLKEPNAESFYGAAIPPGTAGAGSMAGSGVS